VAMAAWAALRLGCSRAKARPSSLLDAARSMVTPLVGEINDAGGTAHFVELDVVNQGQCDAAVAAI
jgi:hypothetical protein